MDTRKIIVVTGIGVVSPYGIGLDKLHAGLLAGKNCLLPCNDFYPGFIGSAASVTESLEIAVDSTRFYSRSDRLVMVAADDAVAGFDRQQPSFRDSGVIMASTVGGLSEFDPGIAPDPAAWYRQNNGLARATE